MTAQEILQKAADIMVERGKQYDKPEGERSMGAAVRAFNAITGKALTEPEGWLLLQVLKDVRQWQNPGRYHADSAEDCIAYAALKAEALAASSAPEFPDESRIDAIGQNGNDGQHYSFLGDKWKEAPDWAQWAAMDSDGVWRWFSDEPRIEDELLTTDGRYEEFSSHPRPCSNWRESLEPRP